MRSKLPGRIFGQGISPARTLLCLEKDAGYTGHELDCFLSSLDYCGNVANINPAGLSAQCRRRGTRSQSGFAKQSADRENVKGLFSVGGTWDFAEVLFELAALGYGVEYALLNSSAFGVPQNRERIYIVGDLTARSGAILKKRTHKCTIHYNKVNTKRRYPHDNTKQI